MFLFLKLFSEIAVCKGTKLNYQKLPNQSTCMCSTVCIPTCVHTCMCIYIEYFIDFFVTKVPITVDSDQD
jgi:hypothetical protein